MYMYADLDRLRSEKPAPSTSTTRSKLASFMNKGRATEEDVLCKGHALVQGQGVIYACACRYVMPLATSRDVRIPMFVHVMSCVLDGGRVRELETAFEEQKRAHSAQLAGKHEHQRRYAYTSYDDAREHMCVRMRCMQLSMRISCVLHLYPMHTCYMYVSCCSEYKEQMSALKQNMSLVFAQNNDLKEECERLKAAMTTAPSQPLTEDGTCRA